MVLAKKAVLIGPTCVYDVTSIIYQDSILGNKILQNKELRD